MGLTVKQENFVQGLFKGLSQRRAYKEAGYKWEGKSDNYIDKLAHELAKDSKVTGRLHELQQKQAEESKWDLDKLINEWSQLAEKCGEAKPVLDKFGNPTGEYQFAWGGVAKSLENIGKLLGHYKEKVEHSGEIKMPTITIKSAEKK